MFSVSEWFHWIDLAGVAVFAISGTLMAYRKYMDGFGVIVLAAVTAIGGGTLRDMILDSPVFWVHDPSFFYVILIAAIGTIVWLRYYSSFPLRYLLIADAFGLAFFNVMGLQKALAFGATPFVAIALGTMTGVFGGLLRDVICREIPLVLKGELYATTCIFGGAVYVAASWLNLHADIVMLAALLSTLLSRLASMRWNWHLPVFPVHGENEQ
ncbi:trimeric intracellular cation channel family protein [Aliiglaciecola sp. LCG003]|uniref:trimeric intracellular cation channel family protein n=1 Tax=Aliiglaciecola sp. LCG003 TaxID=3053655 RepID=UPI002574676C|nr:trimeric intracellular cation channel family protein [Aliiglaciecola sp. LCG003]WJG09358.1 trimeric intracellular cation channel family protein [Aliiglaciecola sp. LCG003]